MAEEFFFEREGKEYTSTLVDGKIQIQVLDPSKDETSAQLRPATWLETSIAFQVMAYMFMRSYISKG